MRQRNMTAEEVSEEIARMKKLVDARELLLRHSPGEVFLRMAQELGDLERKVRGDGDEHD